MKILQAIPYTTNGGAENVVVDLVNSLQECGHDVSLLVNYGFETDVYYKALKSKIHLIELKNHKIVNLKTNIVFFNLIIKVLRRIYYVIDDFFASYKIRKILNNEKFDVVHMHMNVNEIFKNSITNEKVVYTCHSDIDRYIKKYGEKWFNNLKELSKKNLRIISLNNNMKNRIKELLPDAEVVYIPNGVDFEGYKKRFYDREVFRKEIGLSRNASLIGHVGRLDEVKNHEKSFSIIKYIVQNHGNNFYLIVVGGGNDTYTNYLKQKVKDMEIDQNVMFLGYRSDVIEIISALDAAILPSKNEGFPLTALELQSKNIRSIFSMATPKEAVCNDNCFRLDIKEPDEKWANLLLGENTEIHNHSLPEFDKYKVLEDTILLYNK